MKKLFIISTAMLLIAGSMNAQVAINKDGTNPATNSILHVKGDTACKHILFEPGENGNVGIGTINPEEKLDIQGNVEISGTDGKIVLPNSHYDTKIELFKGGEEKIGTSDHQIMLIAGDGVDANIAFFGGLMEIMRVETGNGRVGILTDSPSDNLSIGEKVLISADDYPDDPPVGSCVLFFDGEDLLVKNSEGEVIVIADFTLGK